MSIFYERMSMAVLAQHAATEHEQQDAAARAYVERICDLALEWQMAGMGEPGPAWPSAAACFGDGTGASTKEPDVMFLAYERGIKQSYWHDRAHRAIGKLPERTRLALLIRQRKSKSSNPSCKWQREYKDIVANIAPYAQELGWPGHNPVPDRVRVFWGSGSDGVRRRHEVREPVYGSAQALKMAAHHGRVELLMLSKQGVV